MNNGFSNGVVSAALRLSTVPLTLILKQTTLPYTPQAGDSLLLKFDGFIYTPPTV